MWDELTILATFMCVSHVERGRAMSCENAHSSPFCVAARRWWWWWFERIFSILRLSVLVPLALKRHVRFSSILLVSVGGGLYLWRYRSIEWAAKAWAVLRPVESPAAAAATAAVGHAAVPQAVVRWTVLGRIFVCRNVHGAGIMVSSRDCVDTKSYARTGTADAPSANWFYHGKRLWLHRLVDEW